MSNRLLLQFGKIEFIHDETRDKLRMYDAAKTSFAKNFHKTHMEIACCCNHRWSTSLGNYTDLRKFYLEDQKRFTNFKTWIWAKRKEDCSIRKFLNNASKWLLDGHTVWLTCKCDEKDRQALNSTCNAPIIKETILYLVNQLQNPIITVRKVKNKNLRSITAYGITKTSGEWAEILNTSTSNIDHRIHRVGSPFLKEPTQEEIETIKNKSNKLLKRKKRKKQCVF